MKKSKAFNSVFVTLISLIMILTVMPSAGYAGSNVSIGDAEIPPQYEEGYTIHNCLDISSWNGDLGRDQWKAITDAGVDSVIIRAGYSKLNTGRYAKDSRFVNNIRNAHKYGLAIGVYYFSTALSTKEAEDEADFLLNIIEPYRSLIDLPVVFDYETNRGGRLNVATLRNLGVKKCTAICSAFCDKIAAEHFEPMIYASRALLDNNLDSGKLESKYRIWMAQYSSDLSAPGYKGEYDIWQYTSSARIPGVKSRLDANYIFEENYSALKAPKNIRSKKKKTSTVTYNLSEGVKASVPTKSDSDTAKTSVTDSMGDEHSYTVYKEGYSDYSSDKCLIKCLQSGFAKAKKIKSDKINNLPDFAEALNSAGIPCTYNDASDENIYLNIKRNLAAGKPVIISISSDLSKWEGEHQNLLLIGMDEDGRAIVADSKDREWSGDDQRIKLAGVDELISYIDSGYIIIRQTKK